MPHRPQLDPRVFGVQRFVAGVFGFVFAGIGLTTLIGMWAAPFGEFGSPPLFFRVFASFIALAFLGMGGAVLFGAIAGGTVAADLLARQSERPDVQPPGPGASPLNYACTNCGATLSQEAEVSPLGDVKCPFCKQWFNIHRA